MTELQINLIRNIKRYRRISGITQMELAERCDVSSGYISEIEIGRKYPSHVMFQKIADALTVEPYKLLMDARAIEDFDRLDLVYAMVEDLRRAFHRDIADLLRVYASRADDHSDAAEDSPTYSNDT
jgi:transcriptional regulator with XRE-family HTH domain